MWEESPQRPLLKMEMTMETAMEDQKPQAAKKPVKRRKKLIEPSIADLIKYTPNLERYIVASIITKCGEPEGYARKYKFNLYKGWDTGNRQRGRVCFYHKGYDKKKDLEIMVHLQPQEHLLHLVEQML